MVAQPRERKGTKFGVQRLGTPWIRTRSLQGIFADYCVSQLYQFMGKDNTPFHTVSAIHSFFLFIA